MLANLGLGIKLANAVTNGDDSRRRGRVPLVQAA